MPSFENEGEHGGIAWICKQIGICLGCQAN